MVLRSLVEDDHTDTRSYLSVKRSIVLGLRCYITSTHCLLSHYDGILQYKSSIVVNGLELTNGSNTILWIDRVVSMNKALYYWMNHEGHGPIAKVGINALTSTTDGRSACSKQFQISKRIIHLLKVDINICLFRTPGAFATFPDLFIGWNLLRWSYRRLPVVRDPDHGHVTGSRGLSFQNGEYKSHFNLKCIN